MPRRRHLPLPTLLVLLLALPASAEDGAPVQVRPPVRIIIASYNVWLIPIVAQAYESRKARIPGALRTQDLDVVCIQEAWLATDREALADACKRDFPHRAMGGGGLMILSRYPMTRSAFTAFPVYPGLSLPERVAAKGLLEAELDTPAGPLLVVTAHLALAFGPDNPRSAQQRFLLAHLAKDRRMPTVLAADLNIPPVEAGALTPDYRALLQAGLTDAKPPRRLPDGRLDPGPPTRIGWPRPEVRPTTGYWPDHVLYRSSATGALRLRSFRQALEQRVTALSDHNLLRAEFLLADKRAAPGAAR